MTLDIKAFSLTFGLIFSIAVIILSLKVMLLGGGAGLVALLGEFYIGYSVSLIGTIMGAIWAFVDGVILGVLFTLIHNFLIK